MALNHRGPGSSPGRRTKFMWVLYDGYAAVKTEREVKAVIVDCKC